MDESSRMNKISGYYIYIKYGFGDGIDTDPEICKIIETYIHDMRQIRNATYTTICNEKLRLKFLKLPGLFGRIIEECRYLSYHIGEFPIFILTHGKYRMLYNGIEYVFDDKNMPFNML